MTVIRFMYAADIVQYYKLLFSMHLNMCSIVYSHLGINRLIYFYWSIYLALFRLFSHLCIFQFSVAATLSPRRKFGIKNEKKQT